MTISDLQNLIRPGAVCHLVGIGGVSMSPLAEVLAGMGLHVTGSDINDSDTVKRLQSLGIKIHIGHEAENINGAQLLIRTAAAHDDNPEIIAAKEKGVPVFERAQAWGYIMQGYENAICISGTHGKTTTTSMTTHILMAAESDPTVMIGGTLPLLKASHRIGRGDTIVLESCEYYNSFLSFSPTVAVILNVDEDHLDFFSGIEDIKKSFRDFALLTPEDGVIVANGDDANTMDAIKDIGRQVLTFGFSESANVRPENITTAGARTDFDLVLNGKTVTRITLNVPGRHNIMNALAAAAAALHLNLSPDSIKEGLGCFRGAGRRFEFKGTFNGADIYDDYAHHPGELKALIDAVLPLDYRRILLAFQPHTYTRTKALFDDFRAQLSRLENVYLAEIYSAREQNTIGISSKDLADEIPGAVYCATFSELEHKLRSTAGEGDIILTVGAGDIFRVGEHVVSGREPLCL